MPLLSHWRTTCPLSLRTTRSALLSEPWPTERTTLLTATSIRRLVFRDTLFLPLLPAESSVVVLRISGALSKKLPGKPCLDSNTANTFLFDHFHLLRFERHAGRPRLTGRRAGVPSVILQSTRSGDRRHITRMVPLTAKSTGLARLWYWTVYFLSHLLFYFFSLLTSSCFFFRFEWCARSSSAIFFSVSLPLALRFFFLSFLCHFTMYCIFSTNVSIIILTHPIHFQSISFYARWTNCGLRIIIFHCFRIFLTVHACGCNGSYGWVLPDFNSQEIECGLDAVCLWGL